MKNMHLDHIIENEINKIEIHIERRRKNNIIINIHYQNQEKKIEQITPPINNYSIEQLALTKGERTSNIQLISSAKKSEGKNYFWNNIFKKKNKEKEQNKRKTWKEKRTEKKNAPFQYTNILEQIVNMKNTGANYQKIQEKYEGFKSEEALTKAFQDYQDNYQNVKFTNQIKKYDRKISTEEYKNKITKLYKESNDTLKEIAKNLSQEYGMNISTSTISRYARKELRVKNRREAKKDII